MASRLSAGILVTALLVLVLPVSACSVILVSGSNTSLVGRDFDWPRGFPRINSSPGIFSG